MNLNLFSLTLKTIYLIIVIFFFSCIKENHRSVSGCEKDRAISFLNSATQKGLSYKNRKFLNNKAVEILLIQKNDSINRELLFAAAFNYYNLNDWNNSKKITNILFSRSQEQKNLYHVAKSYRFYGFYYDKMNYNDSAFKSFTKAQKILQEFKNLDLLCNVKQDIAALFYKVNDYSGAELSLIEALKISKLTNNFQDKYKIYINLGLCAMEQREYNSAFIYYEKALKIAETDTVMVSERPKAFCLNNIGVNYLHSGNIKKSIFFYETALKEKNLIVESPLIYCRLIDNLAHSKFKNKIFRNLPNLYYKAAKIRDCLNIHEGRADNRLYLSEYYTHINDTVKAKAYALEAYALSEDFRAPNDMLICLKQLVKADPKNALKYSDKYIKISDSMHQLERETRNKFAKITYETEEITQEKDIAVKQKSVYMAGMVSVGLILSLLLIIKTQKSRHKNLMFAQSRQKTNDEIYHLIQSQQAKLDEGREIEKKRIARDLHDGIMNKLSSTRLNLHKLKSNSDKETIENCIPYIDSIHDIEKEIRNIAHDLNNEVFLENDSFQKTLATLFEEQQKTSKAKIHVDVQNGINWDVIKSIKKVNIYRILQEALCNAEKYATAENIFIGISIHKDFILVEIHDDGIGFLVKERQDGIGIKNIRSRAKDCGGLFHIDSKKDTGTTIIVSIPISNS